MNLTLPLTPVKIRLDNKELEALEYAMLKFIKIQATLTFKNKFIDTQTVYSYLELCIKIKKRDIINPKKRTVSISIPQACAFLLLTNTNKNGFSDYVYHIVIIVRSAIEKHLA